MATKTALKVRSWDADPFTTVAEARGSQDSVIEPKLDGIRLLAEVTDDGVRLWTRNGNDKSKHAVKIAAEIGVRFPAGTWLDGEAVTMSIEDGAVHHWGKAQSILGGNPKPLAAQEPLTYVVFDMMAHGAIDARSLPFFNRRSLLETAFGNGEWERVSLVPQYPAVEETHEILLAQGFEGSMVKHLKARYASGQRGKGMGKIKGKWSLDAFIIGSEPGKPDSWIAKEGLIGTVVFAQHDENGKVVERGRCSGMSYEMRKWLTENLDALIAKKQVIEVTHNGVMPSGGIRHPRFIRVRDDKDASEVTLHDA
jgi:ATP-dependent DNA ligase